MADAEQLGGDSEELLPRGPSFFVGCLLGIGLLIVAMPLILFLGLRRSGKHSELSQKRIEALAKQIHKIGAERGQYPIAQGFGEDFSGQKALFQAGLKAHQKWLKDQLMIDGWSGPFIYRSKTGTQFQLISCGPNRKNDHGQFDDLQRTGQIQAPAQK